MILFLGIIFTSTIFLLRRGNQNCLYNGIPALAVYLHSFQNDSYTGIHIFLFIWNNWTSAQHFHWDFQKALNSLSWSFQLGSVDLWSSDLLVQCTTVYICCIELNLTFMHVSKILFWIISRCFFLFWCNIISRSDHFNVEI